MDFHGKHKDFPLKAVFFLYGEHPFRKDSLISKKLDFLVENGMDVGNHTKDHNGFKNAGAEEIQEQIGSEAQYLESVLNRDGYKGNTLALPFGSRIRASEMKVDHVGLYDYLAYFDKHPEERFVSDRQADVITVPEGKQRSIQVPGGKEIYVYTPR